MLIAPERGGRGKAAVSVPAEVIDTGAGGRGSSRVGSWGPNWESGVGDIQSGPKTERGEFISQYMGETGGGKSKAQHLTRYSWSVNFHCLWLSHEMSEILCHCRRKQP